ncbi:hypothetical protein [Bacillus sp. FJAT-52991]|uniref:Uncharacterized protein n=1 Tax=Bacillus kandeliae TaxID=3129297 RepID=A0ABZ2N4K0_9BACI
MRFVKNFVLVLTLPVLAVLYVGLLISALLAALAGLLRTLGVEAVQINIWPDIAVPPILSLPCTLLVSLLLLFCAKYIKHLIKFIYSNIH